MANGSLYALLALGVGATLTDFLRSPFPVWAFEFGVFAFAIFLCLSSRGFARRVRWGPAEVALCAISLWGFAQIAGSTDSSYTAGPYEMWNASLAAAALGATAFIFSSHVTREGLDTVLRVFLWFAFAVSLEALLVHLIRTSEAPGGWGPFPNRNHFAAFLELALPVALWLSEKPIYAGIAASLLAAGVASASRAGATLLVLETIVASALMWRAQRSAVVGFLALSAVFITAVGAGELARRVTQADPFEYRREIAKSTVAMIADHPWRGFGLGTFQIVYPAYAQFDAGKIVDHAHNDWLEWAAEGGIPFALAWLVLAVTLVRPAIRSVWGIGVLAVFLHATVDYPFERLGVSCWIFSLIGALLSERSRRGRALIRRHEFRHHDAGAELKFEAAKSAGAVAVALAVLLMTGGRPAVAGPVSGAAEIGTVTTPGTMQIDRSLVRGNATLFEGTTIETNRSASSIQLSRGAQVSLGAFSRARVFADRVMLEKGDIRFSHSDSAFRLEVPDGLVIRPETAEASAQVTLGNGAEVTVAALAGSWDAWNRRGVLVAKVAAGRVLEFEPQASSTPSRVTGCLTKRSGHFLLTDETTNVMVEVTGEGLQKEQGNRVEITGAQDPAATPAPDASELIRVTGVKRISKGCEKGKQSAAPAGASGERGTGSGVSAKTIAIVAGVAVAAVVGGLAAAGKLKSDPAPQDSLSK